MNDELVDFANRRSKVSGRDEKLDEVLREL